jgi:GntR family transcriptional repressor for pyruvate dehydrogenase complex
MGTSDGTSIWARSRGTRRDSLSDRLTHDLVELIREEGLEPGDRLPSVQSLADIFEVATPTLREALRRLQSTGIVSIRHGSGVYVSTHADRTVLANPHPRKVEPSAVLQLLQTRQLLEPAAAYLAAEVTRSSREPDLTWEAKEVLRDAERMLADEDALTKINMRFHAAVARMSRNSVLADTVDALLTTYLNEQHEILILFDDRRHDYEDHCSILELVEAGRPQEAEQGMREHIGRVIDTVATRLPAT